jgi:hypothetical protein
MGRKLNSFEEAWLFSPEPVAGRQDQAGLSQTQHLQHRIAEQLEVSVAKLSGHGGTLNTVRNVSNSSHSADTQSIRECLELLEAYTRITPSARLPSWSNIRPVC